MQFGVFTVGDVTRDPTTGHSSTEDERVAAILPGFIAARAYRLLLSTATTLITTNDPDQRWSDAQAVG